MPRLIGVLLLIAVGYHTINEPLGFSLSGSIATGIFALCLLMTYKGYQPDQKNWIGWGVIVFGCLFLALLEPGIIMLFPLVIIFIGIWLAELSMGEWKGGGDSGGDGGSDGFWGDGGFDGGDGGGD